MAEAGRQLIETTNGWSIAHYTKINYAKPAKATRKLLKCAKTRSKHLNNWGSEICKYKSKLTNIYLTVLKRIPNNPRKKGDETDQITRERPGRTPSSATNKDDSAYYSKDSKVFDSTYLQSVEIQPEGKIGGEHSETSSKSRNYVSLTGSLISQCSCDDTQMNLDLQTFQTTDDLTGLNIVTDHFQISLEDNSAYE